MLHSPIEVGSKHHRKLHKASPNAFTYEGKPAGIMCSRDDQLYPLAHQLIMLLDYHPRNFTKPATYLEFNTCLTLSLIPAGLSLQGEFLDFSPWMSFR